MNEKTIPRDEIAFWLFVTLLEEKLPLGYYSSHMVECASVMVETFNILFQELDPVLYEILGDVPGAVFANFFRTLFTNFNNP